jgi:hypothetical protein
MMRIIKKSMTLTLVFFLSVSMVLGLELTASTGSNGDISTTTVGYSSTEDDNANEHIGLNPEKGTLSNSFSGTGTLPYSTLRIRDSKGNFAFVSRSIYGKPKTTTWTYDWSTYNPTSATTGESGVGVWMSLTSANANSISGSGYASNREGDAAQAGIQLGSSSRSITSSLSDYNVRSVAFSDGVSVSQSAASATSTGPIDLYGYSNNREYDYSIASVYLTKGSVSSSNILASSAKTSTSASQSASSVVSTALARMYSYGSNREGDSSKFSLLVLNGQTKDLSMSGSSGTSFAETTGSVSDAYGAYSDISSQGLDRALGYQEHWVYNYKTKAWTRTKVKVEKGEGDFGALKANNAHFGAVSVNTRSTKNDVIISANGFGSNTALILDPRRQEFVKDVRGADIRDSVMTSLKNKGYAVTYYSDSAVSKDKVKQMDDYKVSAITTHASSSSIYLSKSTDGTNWDTMAATELKSEYTNNNGMALIIGCNSFADIGTGTWADAVSAADVRGGTTSSWGIVYSRDYINRFFRAMSAGYTATNANDYAAGKKGEKLLLLGDTGFTL